MPSSPATLALPFTIAGVDEVGRGPLAGPVVAAAVVLDPHRPVDGLDDSKRLGEAERERLDVLIRRRSLAWWVASASVDEIDELNILHASLLAMRRALDGLVRRDERPRAAAPAGGGEADPGAADPGAADFGAADLGAADLGAADLGAGGVRIVDVTGDAARDGGLRDPFGGRPGAPWVAPALVLVDGNRCPDSAYPIAAIVGGDARVQAIAAASIVAKVARDRLMLRWHERYPGFGFDAHKGYATKRHRDALERLGATPLHRRSFAPVRAAIGRSDRPAGGEKVARAVPVAVSLDRETVRSTDEPPSPNEP